MMDFDVASFGLPPRTLVLQTLSALLVPMLAALFPILGGARTTVRQAIDRTGLSAGNTLVSRLLARVHGLPPLLNLALRNVFRKWARMLLTLAALALGGAIFIAVLGIRQSLLDAIDMIQRVKNYDVEIHFSQMYPIAHIEREARRVPGVVAVESWGGADANCVFGDEHVSRSLTLIGVPPETDMTQPSILEGRWLQPGEQNTVFIDADMADMIGATHMGDEVVLRIGGDEQPWRLVGVAGRMFSPHAFIDRADFERLMGMTGYANRLVIRTESHEPSFQALVEKRLKDHFERADMLVTYSWTSGPGNQAIATQLDMVIVILLAMAILVAIVGGLGLASTMGLNVLERTREIGILRSLGAKSGVVRRMVILEGVATSLVSFVLAIPLSVPISLALGQAVGQELLMQPLEYAFSGIATLLWLGIVLIIAILASLLPANSAANLTIRETLAYLG
jgi:putative ABC transport system permease protein